ncbi:MAG: electron-transfer flavoprotein:ubiquinone oxidoreductase [Phycisphaerae bacterium]|nr:electron-transfer flavoprotein:ubiquinone oxidoreductase [Phycisphaerae bacterium]
MSQTDYSRTQVLIVGSGPAGLAAAIKLKAIKPETQVCVIEKAHDSGNHNLSGAVLEAKALHKLLDASVNNWQEGDEAKEVLAKKVDKDDVMFFAGDKFSFNIFPVIKIAKKFGLGFGQMMHHGDYIVSVSQLTRWLGRLAKEMGVEVLCGFSAAEILWDKEKNLAIGVKLVDQGLDKEGHPQPNYVAGEDILADAVIIAEGCDGLLAEQFVERAGLKRKYTQLYSLGVKELIKVSEKQYEKFTGGRVVHAMGYPIWTPLRGPAMFGGGIIYPVDKEHIAVGIIVGLDFKYCDFNPQDALTRFKGHKFVKQFIEGGTVVEAGAKMIPEGGWNAVPRDPKTGSIGKSNVMLVGDSAGFVNMLKIKGLHNAIESGICAAQAVSVNLSDPTLCAARYTECLDMSDVAAEMKSAAKFRQTVAKLGATIGFPLSVFSKFMPDFDIERDTQTMKSQKYRLKPDVNFDKDTFTAVAATEHREEQPSHLIIYNRNTCSVKCTPVFGRPCITFCPAGVYETIGGQVKAANSSNCLHCKTCQRKCPFDNISWTVPEGGGGPRYKRM